VDSQLSPLNSEAGAAGCCQERCAAAERQEGPAELLCRAVVQSCCRKADEDGNTLKKSTWNALIGRSEVLFTCHGSLLPALKVL